MRNFFPLSCGVDVVFASNLPMAAGLSSSSALLIGLFKSLASFNGLYERQEFRDAIGSDLEKAEYEFRALLNSDPQDFRAHVGLGRTFCDQGKLLDCIDQFQHAAYYSGNEQSLVDDLKRLYGYFIEEAEQKIANGESTAQLYLQLGTAYVYVGKPQKSEQYFEKARQLSNLE